VIRTRRIPFLRSRPSRPMMIVPVAAAAIGIVLPFTPPRHVLRFAPLPARFFAGLAALIVTYMVLVDLTKIPFYRAYGPRHRAPSGRPVPTGQRGGFADGQPRSRLTPPAAAHGPTMLRSSPGSRSQQDTEVWHDRQLVTPGSGRRNSSGRTSSPQRCMSSGPSGTPVSSGM
jgi:hypothetical protein